MHSCTTHHLAEKACTTWLAGLIGPDTAVWMAKQVWLWILPCEVQCLIMWMELKGRCTLRAKLRYARDTCDTKLCGLQLPLCILNKCFQPGCEAMRPMPATSHALLDQSLGQQFLET